MRRKYSWLMAILAVAAISLIVLQGSQTAPNEPIKIGFIGPLTGGPALWGAGARNMVELAVSEINEKGGIEGRQIQIIYEDGKCSSKGAIEAADKLINIDNVKFILGGHCSPETAAIVPIIDKNKVFLLAGITSADNVMDGSIYAFRTSPPTVELTRKISEIAIENYGKVSILTEQAEFAKSVSLDFKKSFKEMDGKIISEEDYEPVEMDFRTRLVKIKEGNPDAIFISPQNPNSAITALSQITELGINIPIFGNSILITKDVYEKSGKGFNESAFSVIPYTDKTRASALIEKYKNRYGADVPYNLFYVSASYDAVYMMAQAIEKCGEDTDCVRDYFSELEYSGISADYRFRENGDPHFDSWAEIRIINGSEVAKPL